MSLIDILEKEEMEDCQDEETLVANMKEIKGLKACMKHFPLIICVSLFSDVGTLSVEKELFH